MQKELITKNQRGVFKLELRLNQEKPLFNELKQIAESEGLDVYDPNIAEAFTQKYVKDYPDFLPEQTLKMMGKLETRDRILKLVAGIKDIDLHRSDKAVQEYIKSVLYRFTGDKKTIDIVRRVREAAKLLQSLGINNGDINQVFRSFGYDIQSDEFNPAILQDKVYPYSRTREQPKILV